MHGIKETRMANLFPFLTYDVHHLIIPISAISTGNPNVLNGSPLKFDQRYFLTI
jgi:hypothetical protein